VRHDLAVVVRVEDDAVIAQLRNSRHHVIVQRSPAVRTGFSGPLAGFGRWAELPHITVGGPGIVQLLVSQRNGVQLPGEGVDAGREPVEFDADCGELGARSRWFSSTADDPRNPGAQRYETRKHDGVYDGNSATPLGLRPSQSVIPNLAGHRTRFGLIPAFTSRPLSGLS
jgi:hypothetical protein